MPGSRYRALATAEAVTHTASRRRKSNPEPVNFPGYLPLRRTRQ
ncbi:hypothetical protein BSIN_1488 [Burkholderia singularis]|uniref:Uncharacterized protein n=1 Tax=Burkholderia singularis TaxID=1503053 RepID=A0A238GZ07_9BURK|nr:hypothetical protein BSIN_1488 [Burkholderia singularis]